MSARALTLGIPLLLLAAAQGAEAQGRQGLYVVAGQDPAIGPYAGLVELRWNGAGYDFIREVEGRTFRHRGRPLSLVWTGRARDAAGGGVVVDLSLDRMGWAESGPGLTITRSAADGAPLAAQGVFDGALQGGYVGSGNTPLATEGWSFQGPLGPRPLFVRDRQVVPAHAPPSARVRSLLFSLFGSFHALPWVAPHVARPEFQAAIHGFVREHGDFDLHRRRPDLLRLVDRLVDELNLEEAVAKADAFGPTLRAKADLADAEVAARFIEPSGVVANRSAGGAFVPDGDGALWTGVYAYTQALRFAVTGDAQAAARLERVGEALWTQMAITGRPDAFARTLRTTAGQAPLGGSWVQGTGAFAGLEWLQSGNNDMLKGLIWGGLALHEGLPAGHALRARYGQALAALAAAHPVVNSGAQRLVPGNPAMVYGVASLLVGPGPVRDTYRRLARNPWLILYNLSGLGAGMLQAQGICDWSGAHLGVSGIVVQIRLAEHHGLALEGLANRIGLRTAARRLAPVRRSLHALAAAGLGRVPGAAPFDASDALWALREVPYPRTPLREHWALRQDFVVAPYPVLPWKMDWTRNRQRAHGLVAPALFERSGGNYIWKDDPFPQVDGNGGGGDGYPSTDYLFGYWLARAHGVIGPND